MEDYLTDLEEDLLSSLAENEPLIEAIKKVLFFEIYEVGHIKKGKKHEANINWALRHTPAWNAGIQGVDPEVVGREVMLKANALAIVEDAFSRLSEFKQAKTESKKINPAT